mmetsp:Transcript_42084/g.87939  ORF Transcript_42084/g.87939 Transcript_42084/m.87939 type:complete len:254 (-) Transcript_42084:80-841(-)
MTTAALRDRPMAQCTKTLCMRLNSWSRMSDAGGKCSKMSTSSKSSTFRDSSRVTPSGRHVSSPRPHVITWRMPCSCRRCQSWAASSEPSHKPGRTSCIREVASDTLPRHLRSHDRSCAQNPSFGETAMRVRCAMARHSPAGCCKRWMRYATNVAPLRELPASQCSRTEPPEPSAPSMKSQQLGHHDCRSNAGSSKAVSRSKRVNPASTWKAEAPSITDRMCVMPCLCNPRGSESASFGPMYNRGWVSSGRVRP